MPDLPDISQEFTASTAAYVAELSAAVDAAKAFADANHAAVASVAELQAAINGLDGKTIYIDVVTNGVGDTGGAGTAAATAAAAAAADEAASATAKEAAASEAAAGASDEAASAAITEAAAYRMVTDAMEDVAKAEALLAAASRLEADSTASEAAAMALLAPAATTASDSLRGIISAMQGASAPTRAFGLSLTQIHWILGVSFETLAVTIPAIIAFGAGLDVASQGATDMYNHVVALWTACESMGGAFNATMGSVFGLKTVLQSAQNAADPKVYALLGGVINDCKEQFGDLASTGLQVVQMFDEFSARITVDLRSSGGEVNDLLGNMLPDLQEIGQVFGNLGHAILNLAADMPGLAEVLLKVVDGISRVILWISELPPIVITVAMAFEEFYRWGGLVASIISRIGLLLPLLAGAPAAAAVAIFGRIAAIMGSVVGVGAQLVGGLSTVVAGIARVIPAAGGAATALGNLSAGLAEAASNTALMGTFGLLVAATVAIGVGLDHIRNSAQEFIATEQKSVDAAFAKSALDGITALGEAIPATTDKIQQQQAALQQYSGAQQAVGTVVGGFITDLEHINGPIGGAVQGLSNLASSTSIWGKATETALDSVPVIGGALGMLGLGATQAASKIDQLNTEQKELIGTFNTTTGNLNYLAGAYHTSVAGASALAAAAGVNLQTSIKGSGEAAQIAQQEIKNFVTGLGAMGAPAGVIGNDMQYLGIQSQLAGTKVSELNSAYQQWLSSVTGGMSDWSQLQTALQGMQQDASAASASLTGSIGSISTAGGSMAYTLQGMSAAATQSWQQITSAINQAGTTVTWLNTGVAEGVVSNSQYTNTIKAMAGEMLQFVKGSPQAVLMLSNMASAAGAPITSSYSTFAHWVGSEAVNASSKFTNGIKQATTEMGNMSKVATNLSSVVTSQLDAAMSSAIVKTEGISGKTATYIKDLNTYGADSTKTKGAQTALNNALEQAQKLTGEVSAATAKAGDAAQTAAGKIHNEAISAQLLGKYLLSIPKNVSTVITTTYASVYTSTGAAANANVLLHPKAAHGGMVIAGGIIPSFAGGGAIPGFSPGNDNILAALSAGEGVLNPYAMRMIGGAAGLNWLNTAGERGGGSGGGLAHGGGGGSGVLENHVHVHLDGKQIWNSVQRQTLTYGTRNSGKRTGTMAPS
jgi:hypothetical protein